jgi:hypothetical protein
MKPNRLISATIVAAALLAAQASAAADAWNEAVSIGKNGKRSVELPPKVGKWPDVPPGKWAEPPVPGSAFVLEGPDGLVECAQVYFRPGKFCNQYRPGMYAKPRNRAWVVKRGGKWLLCPELKATAGCTGIGDGSFIPFKAQL